MSITEKIDKYLDEGKLRSIGRAVDRYIGDHKPQKDNMDFLLRSYLAKYIDEYFGNDNKEANDLYKKYKSLIRKNDFESMADKKALKKFDDLHDQIIDDIKKLKKK